MKAILNTLRRWLAGGPAREGDLALEAARRSALLHP
jgi:hypothetical protein